MLLSLPNPMIEKPGKSKREMLVPAQVADEVHIRDRTDQQIL